MMAIALFFGSEVSRSAASDKLDTDPNPLHAVSKDEDSADYDFTDPLINVTEWKRARVGHYHLNVISPP